MTETPTEQPVRIAARQYVAPPVLDDLPVLDGLAKHVLRETARNEGRVLVVDTITETLRRPAVLVPTEQGEQMVEMGSVLDTSGRTEPDAYLLAWEADTEPPRPHPIPVTGTADDQGVVRANLTEHDRAGDAMVTFHHGIVGDVVIRAYADGDTPIGYLLAVQIEPGEHQVEVQPQTAYLTAQPVEDDPEIPEVPC